MLGDYNEILNSNEKRGGRAQPQWLLDGFQNAVVDYGLMDVPQVGPFFTWERSRGQDGWVEERLDRCMAGSKWMHLFPMSEVRVIDITTSDRLPLLLSLVP